MTLVRVTQKYVLGATGENAANVTWCLAAGGFLVQSDADTIATKANLYWTGIVSRLMTGAQQVAIRVDVVNPATGRVQYGFDTTPSAVQGSGVGNSLPTEVTLVASLRTGLAGPRNRGRIYCPPFTTNALAADGRCTTAVRDQLATAVVSYLRGLIAASFTPVVWSRKFQTSQAITQVSVGDVFDVQRGRRNRLIESRGTTTL